MEQEEERLTVLHDTAPESNPADTQPVEDSDPAGDIVLPEEVGTIPFTGAKFT